MYLRSGNLAKSRDLLTDYSKFLYPSHIKNVLLLGESFILFEEKKYKEALSTVSKINTKLITIKIYMRKLILKLEYELNDYDSNKDSIDNFRHFVKNSNQISEIIKKALVEFLDLLNDFVNTKSNEFDDYKFSNLKARAETFNDLLDRSWFQKQLKKRSP